jgi:hypothetical protein
MASASTVTQDLQDAFLSTVRDSQEIALGAIKTFVDTVQSFTPAVPSFPMPLIDRLPKPHQVIDSGYEFAEKLLASQRKFAVEALKAAAPLLPGDSAE